MNDITYRKSPPITDAQIRSSWKDTSPEGQKADLQHLHNLMRAIERARRVNQELCCTPLRHRLDEQLCEASRTCSKYINENSR